MKTPGEKTGAKEGVVKASDPQKKIEIKPDYPLSEKDEVKQAEDRLRRFAKKIL